MDKLKKLFRRKKRGDIIQEPAPMPVTKRSRTPDEPVVGRVDIDDDSPRKRARRELPEAALHQEHSRTDSHTGSIGSTGTTPLPPKLEWDPNPVGGDLSSIFDGLSTESAPRIPPRARPYGSASLPARKQSAQNRHSLPPAAIFARGLKRFNEDTTEPDTARPKSALWNTSIGAGRDAAPVQHVGPHTERPAELPSQPARDSMTLDDILSQPLFGDRPEGEQRPQSRYFSHLSGDGPEPMDTTAQSQVVPGKQNSQPGPEPEPKKPKRHPLIP